MWQVTADPKSFAEAVSWFREKIVVTKDDWLTLSEEARRRAFFVSGVTQLELLQDVLDGVESGIDGQLPYRDFQQQFQERLAAAWGDSELRPGWRTELIYRQNALSAYNAGRWQQQQDPELRRARPFYMYDAVMDSRTSAICRPLNGAIRSVDDPWWDSHTPPLHFLCRSALRMLTRKQAETRGITEDARLPPTEADAGFGKPPSLTDWQPDLSRYDPRLRTEAVKKLRPPEGEAVVSPVSISLDTSKLSGKTRSAVNAALKAVDQAHTDGVLPQIPIQSTRSKKYLGVYSRDGATGDPVRIGISASGKHKELTLAHEIGHFLDHQAIGTAGQFASQTSKMKAVKEAIAETSAHKALKAIASKGEIELNGAAHKLTPTLRKHINYLLSDEEVWARAYAQYIAQKSGNAAMKSQLSAILKAPTWAIKQWTDEDFAPIAKAIDELFRSLGWIPKS